MGSVGEYEDDFDFQFPISKVWGFISLVPLHMLFCKSLNSSDKSSLVRALELRKARPSKAGRKKRRGLS